MKARTHAAEIIFVTAYDAPHNHEELLRDGGRAVLLKPVDPVTLLKEIAEALKMSRHVLAFKLGVNPRTLERWEQGRSKPNEQAAALIWLVRKYPDTLERLESLAASASAVGSYDAA